jgi:hypothetical protein
MVAWQTGYALVSYARISGFNSHRYHLMVLVVKVFCGGANPHGHRRNPSSTGSRSYEIL